MIEIRKAKTTDHDPAGLGYSKKDVDLFMNGRGIES